jgi:hypothetical protein
MKTLKYLSILGIFAASFLTLYACTGEQEKQDNQDKQGAVAVSQPDTDIHTATFMDNLSAVRQHIEAGTDLNIKDAYGSTPLMIAVTFGRAKIASELIEAGADLNITNNVGSTALHSAAFLCRTDIVRMLIEGGADKSIRNNFGSTALESVSTPFENVRPVYDQFSRDLGPLGLKLDYAHLEKTRPVIAGLLR